MAARAALAKMESLPSRSAAAAQEPTDWPSRGADYRFGNSAMVCSLVDALIPVPDEIETTERACWLLLAVSSRGLLRRGSAGYKSAAFVLEYWRSHSVVSLAVIPAIVN